MNRSALIVLSALLAGCNVQTKHDRNDGDSKVSITSEDADGNVSFDVPFAKGEIKLPGGSIRSSDFDIDGVKMYPGATISGINVEAKNGRSEVNLRFKSADSPDKVRAYFVDAFRKKGVSANVSGNAITGNTKDGDRFAIDVRPAATGSEGTLRIDGEDDD